MRRDHSDGVGVDVKIILNGFYKIGWEIVDWVNLVRWKDWCRIIFEITNFRIP